MTGGDVGMLSGVPRPRFLQADGDRRFFFDLTDRELEEQHEC